MAIAGSAIILGLSLLNVIKSLAVIIPPAPYVFGIGWVLSPIKCSGSPTIFKLDWNNVSILLGSLNDIIS
jgi:hypothetical protein